jgi:hypothetical protein
MDVTSLSDGEKIEEQNLTGKTRDKHQLSDRERTIRKIKRFVCYILPRIVCVCCYWECSCCCDD